MEEKKLVKKALQAMAMDGLESPIGKGKTLCLLFEWLVNLKYLREELLEDKNQKSNKWTS